MSKNIETYHYIDGCPKVGVIKQIRRDYDRRDNRKTRDIVCVSVIAHTTAVVFYTSFCKACLLCNRMK